MEHFNYNRDNKNQGLIGNRYYGDISHRETLYHYDMYNDLVKSGKIKKSELFFIPRKISNNFNNDSTNIFTLKNDKNSNVNLQIPEQLKGNFSFNKKDYYFSNNFGNEIGIENNNYKDDNNYYSISTADESVRIAFDEFEELLGGNDKVSLSSDFVLNISSSNQKAKSEVSSKQEVVDSQNDSQNDSQIVFERLILNNEDQLGGDVAAPLLSINASYDFNLSSVSYSDVDKDNNVDVNKDNNVDVNFAAFKKLTINDFDGELSLPELDQKIIDFDQEEDGFDGDVELVPVVEEEVDNQPVEVVAFEGSVVEIKPEPIPMPKLESIEIAEREEDTVEIKPEPIPMPKLESIEIAEREEDTVEIKPEPIPMPKLESIEIAEREEDTVEIKPEPIPMPKLESIEIAEREEDTVEIKPEPIPMPKLESIEIAEREEDTVEIKPEPIPMPKLESIEIAEREEDTVEIKPEPIPMPKLESIEIAEREEDTVEIKPEPIPMPKLESIEIAEREEDTVEIKPEPIPMPKLESIEIAEREEDTVEIKPEPIPMPKLESIEIAEREEDTVEIKPEPIPMPKLESIEIAEREEDTVEIKPESVSMPQAVDASMEEEELFEFSRQEEERLDYALEEEEVDYDNLFAPESFEGEFEDDEEEVQAKLYFQPDDSAAKVIEEIVEIAHIDRLPKNIPNILVEKEEKIAKVEIAKKDEEGRLDIIDNLNMLNEEDLLFEEEIGYENYAEEKAEIEELLANILPKGIENLYAHKAEIFNTNQIKSCESDYKYIFKNYDDISSIKDKDIDEKLAKKIFSILEELRSLDRHINDLASGMDTQIEQLSDLEKKVIDSIRILYDEDLHKIVFEEVIEDYQAKIMQLAHEYYELTQNPYKTFDTQLNKLYSLGNEAESLRQDIYDYLNDPGLDEKNEEQIEENLVETKSNPIKMPQAVDASMEEEELFEFSRQEEERLDYELEEEEVDYDNLFAPELFEGEFEDDEEEVQAKLHFQPNDAVAKVIEEVVEIAHVHLVPKDIPNILVEAEKEEDKEIVEKLSNVKMNENIQNIRNLYVEIRNILDRLNCVDVKEYYKKLNDLSDECDEIIRIYLKTSQALTPSKISLENYNNLLSVSEDTILKILEEMTSIKEEIFDVNSDISKEFNLRKNIRSSSEMFENLKEEMKVCLFLDGFDGFNKRVLVIQGNYKSLMDEGNQCKNIDQLEIISDKLKNLTEECKTLSNELPEQEFYINYFKRKFENEELAEEKAKKMNLVKEGIRFEVEDHQKGEIEYLIEEINDIFCKIDQINKQDIDRASIDSFSKDFQKLTDSYDYFSNKENIHYTEVKKFENILQNLKNLHTNLCGFSKEVKLEQNEIKESFNEMVANIEKYKESIDSKIKKIIAIDFNLGSNLENESLELSNQLKDIYSGFKNYNIFDVSKVKLLLNDFVELDEKCVFDIKDQKEELKDLIEKIDDILSKTDNQEIHDDFDKKFKELKYAYNNLDDEENVQNYNELCEIEDISQNLKDLYQNIENSFTQLKLTQELKIELLENYVSYIKDFLKMTNEKTVKSQFERIKEKFKQNDDFDVLLDSVKALYESILELGSDLLKNDYNIPANNQIDELGNDCQEKLSAASTQDTNHSNYEFDDFDN